MHIGCNRFYWTKYLKILGQHPDKYSVFAVSAHSRISELVEICKQFRPKVVVVPEQKIAELKTLFAQQNISDIDVLAGQEGLVDIASHTDVDIVMAAIVGAAGLLPTLAAVKAGKRVLLANKEALVMSGEIMMQALVSIRHCYCQLILNIMQFSNHYLIIIYKQIEQGNHS